MSTAFVTGGSGFIGKRLIARLRAEGWTVKALARSESSAQVVREAGAEPTTGELASVESMRAGAQGADITFHAAAHLEEWGRRKDFIAANVDGTRNAIEASRGAGVTRFVHVGTEAGLMNGRPLVNVDETTPLRPDSKALYSATKAISEQVVRDANENGFETVVLRPRAVWGPGDATLLPALLDAMESGKFVWMGKGRHMTATTHVDNTVEGLWLAATRGKPGGVYFVTDGDPVMFRDFVSQLVATQGVAAPHLSIPIPVGRAMAATCETLWRVARVKQPPPLTRLAFWLSALECTIDISHAREELGYRPVKTVADGMAELRGLHAQRA